MIPTTVIELILDYTSSTNYTDKQKTALEKILIELWLFIFNEQITDRKLINLGGFTCIHGNEMRQFRITIQGKEFKANSLIDILIFLKLASRNGKYSYGKKNEGINPFPCSYKIETSVLSFGKLTAVELDMDKVFMNIRPKSHFIDLFPQHAHLIEDIYSASIRLDDYLHYLLNNIGMPLHPKKVKRTINGNEVHILEPQFLTEDKAYLYFHMAMKINIGNIWVAEFSTGRFASSVSNMSFTATKFFQMDKSDLIDIDIKNSQPLLLAKLINCPEYQKDVEDGVFYENMAKAICKLKKQKYTSEHREMFKPNCYRYLLFNNEKLGNTGNIAKAMNQLYPGALDQINQLKEDGTLAGKLQRLEADIFVDYIGALNIKKLLRHDQVLIASGYVKLVKTLLINKYAELGLAVSFG